MKLDIGGEETIQATVEQLWSALNDPLVLTRCIPGCKTMTEMHRTIIRSTCSCGGGGRQSFEGDFADKLPPMPADQCWRGHPVTAMAAPHLRSFEGPNVAPEVSGRRRNRRSVAGVGNALTSVSKHLVGKFFTTLRKEFDNPVAGAA